MASANRKNSVLRSALVGESLRSLRFRWKVVILMLVGRRLRMIVTPGLLNAASVLYLPVLTRRAKLLVLGAMTCIVGSVTVLRLVRDDVRMSCFPVTTIILLIARLILDSMREEISIAWFRVVRQCRNRCS